MFGFLNATPLPDPAKSAIGVIAGKGGLPVFLSRKIKSLGFKLAVVSVQSDCVKDLSEIADADTEADTSDPKKAIEFLKRENITHIVFSGKITKTHMMDSDSRETSHMNELSGKQLPGFGDEAILKTVEVITRLNGFRVLGPADILSSWVAEKGTMGKVHPSESDLADITYGIDAARKIGRMDIGQSVVIKGRSVLLVEGILGTDQMILDAARAGVEKTIVVKTSKPQQNIKFDMPVIGRSTVECAAQAKCSGIAIEAGRTLIADREVILDLADRNNLFIYGA